MPPKKKPSKKTTKRKKPACQFGKWKVPKDVHVRDGGIVDGENYGRIPFPDYDPEDGEWGRR